MTVFTEQSSEPCYCSMGSLSVIVCCLFFLSACSTLRSGVTDDVDGATVADREQGVAAESVIELSVPPNPYFQHNGLVDPQARQAFDQALTLIDEKNYPAAIDLLDTLITDFPDLSGPYLNLAIVYAELNQMARSKTLFEKAIKVNPDNLEAYNQLAIVHRQLGEFEAAERRYQQALRRWSGYGDAYLNLGILQELYMGKLEMALQNYRRYQTLQSKPDRRVNAWVQDLQRRLARQRSETDAGNE